MKLWLSIQIVDPQDASKKTTSFIISKEVAARHIGISIGPFEQVDLTLFRESDEDDRLGQNAVPVVGYCLPGRVEDLKNTCFPLAKVGCETTCTDRCKAYLSRQSTFSL